MSVVDPLFMVGGIRRVIWRFWYPFVTRRLAADEVLFLNYAYEEDPPCRLPLAADDEPNRGCIQLYHHVATQVNLQGCKVLEVSCGHGGGASYLTRTLHPASYTALDLNRAGIAFCRRRHRIGGLDFVRGDAEQLPFADAMFDAVINVEASHCYGSLARFCAEVARVLRPGGHFLYADFRLNFAVDAWEATLAGAPLRRLAMRDITAEVARGMELNSERSNALIVRHLPRPFHALGADFAGLRGSRFHTAALRRELSYRSYCFEK